MKPWNISSCCWPRAAAAHAAARASVQKKASRYGEELLHYKISQNRVYRTNVYVCKKCSLYVVYVFVNVKCVCLIQLQF